ncbi:phage baseplate upper protein [Enterococcus gallinarum]|uniref:phage baseplate upper protein n=1 Tax=Enterococcus gallinarum TaxID=1353 RepID=UPI00288EE3FA|nr:phage baseplate upper protein [Enterococcus gallinarum]MDT2727893.1 phage baseplate upper protein [Enterococcus gallinarum]
MAVRYPITLNVMEPNNNIGLLKIRQADEETQTLVVQILEDALPKSYEGLQVFFCARIGQTPGLGIIEQKLTDTEMTDPKNGKLEYTFRAEDWQVLGRQNGYFSFRKMKNDHEYVQQFSTRDFTYEITKNIYSDGIKEIKTDGSTYVWTFEDLLRLFNEYIASGKTNWEDFVEQNKEIIESIDPGGTILSRIGIFDSFRAFDNEVIAKMRNEFTERGVNPKWFGAKGDGVTDDGTALLATHIYANTNHIDVFYPELTYYIGQASEIPIKTNVDFNNSTFIIDDSYESEKSVFLVQNDSKDIVIKDDDLSIFKGLISTNSKYHEEFVKFGRAFVTVEDETKQMYIRDGANSDYGIVMSDSFIIDDGNILSKINYDYDDPTKMTIRKYNEKRIVIKNATFISKNNASTSDLTKYYHRGISFERNNVDAFNMSHKIENNSINKRPNVGFFQHKNCADQTFENIELTPRYPTTLTGSQLGTYEMATNNVCSISYKNVKGQDFTGTYWGAHGGNRMKDVLFDNCKINRIDSHTGSTNVTIIDSVIGVGGISLIGYGNLLVRKTTVVSDVFMKFRSDYGASWKGNIYIDDCELDARYAKSDVTKLSVIRVSANTSHNFGYPLYLGEDLVKIKDFKINDGELSVLINLIDYNLTSSGTSLGHKIAKVVDIDTIFTASGKGVRVFGTGNFQYVKGQTPGEFERLGSDLFVSDLRIVPNAIVKVAHVNLDIEKTPNVTRLLLDSSFFDRNFAGSINEELDILESENGLIPSFILSNCANVAATLADYACTLEMNNCDIISMHNAVGGSRSIATFVNCRFIPRVTDENKTDLLFRPGGKAYDFVNCVFYNPTNRPSGIDITKIYNMLFNNVAGNRIIPKGNYTNCRLADNFSGQNINIGIIRMLNGAHDTVYHEKSGPTTQRPSTGNPGSVYYDTTVNKIMIFDNSIGWRQST